jgi:hypothetical protein
MIDKLEITAKVGQLFRRTSFAASSFTGFIYKLSFVTYQFGVSDRATDIRCLDPLPFGHLSRSFVLVIVCQ